MKNFQGNCIYCVKRVCMLGVLVIALSITQNSHAIGVASAQTGAPSCSGIWDCTPAVLGGYPGDGSGCSQYTSCMEGSCGGVTPLDNGYHPALMTVCCGGSYLQGSFLNPQAQCPTSGGGGVTPTSTPTSTPTMGGYDCQNDQQTAENKCTYDPNLVNATNNQDSSCGNKCGINHTGSSPKFYITPDTNTGVVNHSLAIPFIATYHIGIGIADKDMTQQSVWTVLDNPNVISLGGGDFMAFASGTANIKATYNGNPLYPTLQPTSTTAVLSITDSATSTPTSTPVGTNSVGLWANKVSGTDPLGGAVLTAIAGGNAQGNFDYNFWWNCSYAGTDKNAAAAQCGPLPVPQSGACVSNAAGETCSTMPALDLAQQANAPTYTPAGTYTAKVIMARGSAPAAEDRLMIVVNPSPPSQPHHLECMNNACTSVAGSASDVNRCLTNADCGGGGGGGSPLHGVCDAVQKACINKAGAASSTCSTDPACGGGGGLGLSHLACQNNSCVIVSGLGNNNGCFIVGGTCNSNPLPPPPPSCTFSANPNNVIPPAQSTLSWNCSNVASCTINGGQVLNPNSGTLKVSPTQTANYVLNCLGSGGSGSFTGFTTVTVGGAGIREINP